MKILLISIFYLLLSCQNQTGINLETNVEVNESYLEMTKTNRSLNKNLKKVHRKNVSQIDPRTSTTERANRFSPTIDCRTYCAGNPLMNLTKGGYNYLAFPNFGARGVGRCRGHALLTQKMSMLASFESYGGCDLSAAECVHSYRLGISKVLDFKTHTFKGFRNLEDFSSHPKIMPILKGIVAGTPSRYRAGRAFIKNRTYATAQLNTFFEAKRRISLGENPYVGIKGLTTQDHAVTFYREVFMGDKNVLCAKDPNARNDGPLFCENYAYVEGSEVFYKSVHQAADKMFLFKLTSDEDRRVQKYKKALKSKCIKESRAALRCK